MSYPVIDFDELKACLPEILIRRALLFEPNLEYLLKEILGDELLLGYRFDEYSGKQRRRIGLMASWIIKRKETPWRKVRNLKNQSCVYKLIDEPIHYIDQIED